MNEWGIYLSLFTMGLVSSAHCIGMCGGIMGALTLAIPAAEKNKRYFILICYNLGRILSYGLMGFLFGYFAQQITALGGATFLRIIAGLLLIAMGLYLADWWRGLVYVEKLGRYLWVYVQPLGKPFMPVDSIYKALILGAVWGWLPCGLVYSALGLSMSQGDAHISALAMVFFGLGTLPAVLAVGFAAQQLIRVLQQRHIRIALALLLIIFGLWTLWFAQPHSHHHHAEMPAPASSEMDHSQHMHHHE